MSVGPLWMGTPARLCGSVGVHAGHTPQRACTRVERPLMPIPPVRLRHLLALEREAGAEFKDAWERSVEPTICGIAGEEQEQWRIALWLSRPFWERTFERRPTTGS